MKHQSLALLLAHLITLLFCTVTLFAQGQGSVRGTVVDEVSGEPLIGAYVSVAGDKTGAMTDLDGQFEIKLPANAGANTILKIAYVGYEEKDVTVAQLRQNGRIGLNIQSELLQETIVVGYGVQKKVSSVGSISTTSGEDLLKVGNVNTVSEALQGKLNGVVTFNTTGQPGAEATTIYIRGKSSWQNSNPLVLVDGIERNMNDVDFNEIESISVLKDASATAVYGVRGGNGVILLTTKRGTYDKPTVSFNTSVSLKTPTARADWADYPTSMNIYNEAQANEGSWGKLIPMSTIDAWQNALDRGNYGPYNDFFPQVNWYDQILQTAVSENYNVNVNGKSDFMKYFASVGYQHDGSIFNIPRAETYDPRAWYNRLNWRANFDFNLTKTTTFSVNVAGKVGHRNEQYYSDVYAKLTLAPTNSFPIKWSDGYFGDDSNKGANPIADITNGGQVHFKSFQSWYDLKLVQKLDFITEGLKAHAQLSYNSYSTNRNRVRTGGIYGGSDHDQMNSFPREYRTYDYTKPMYDTDGNWIGYQMIAAQSGFHGNQYYMKPAGVDFDATTSLGRRLYYEVGLDYARTFGGHEVTAMGLWNRQKVDSSGGSSFEFPSYREDWVGRVTYNWKEKYLSEFNVSYTGSEKFAPGKRYGLFPSFSLGWRITEEPWMKPMENVLSNMKVRYSWGEVGTDAGAGRFQYIQLYEQNGTVNYGKDENTAFGPRYKEGTIAQPNATWETSVKQNIGIETTWFKKLRVNVDLFDEQRSGILLSPRTTAAWVGASIAAANLGKTKNHGIDLEVNWNDNIGKDFHYHINFAWSASENRVVFRDDPKNFLEHERDAGKSIGFQTRYIVTGNYETVDDMFNAAQSSLIAASKLIPGDLIYMDFNADGIINNKDVVTTSHRNYPLTTYALTIGFEYKRFAISAMFYSPQDVYKNYINSYLWDFPSGYVKAQPQTLERWTYETANSSGVRRPAIHISDTGHNQSTSTYRFRDYSYYRLKNVEMSYTLPKKWQRAVGMSNCQLYANGNNLITWWKGDKRIDPELANSDGAVNENANVYPIVRSYTFGVRFSF